MNRIEFMEQLDKLLSELPESERSEAMQYYNDYFDDAGPEHEQEILQELGTPERVAQIIKDGLFDKNSEKVEYTETGYHGATYEKVMEIADRKKKSGGQTDNQGDSVAKILLIIVLAIVALPVVIGALGTLFGVLLAAAIVIGVFALLGVGFVIGGIVMFIYGIVKLFVIPLGAVTLMGGGMVLAGLGILFGLAVAVVVTVVIPLIWKGIMYLVKWPERRRKGGATV